MNAKPLVMDAPNKSYLTRRLWAAFLMLLARFRQDSDDYPVKYYKKNQGRRIGQKNLMK
jgi:hypothetical protein